jgi:hypothetical protein
MGTVSASVGGLDVRVGCIFEELCDEVGGALEGDCLAGRCLRCGHGVSAKQGGERVSRGRSRGGVCYSRHQSRHQPRPVSKLDNDD